MTVLTMKDVEVHFHVLQPTTEQFQLCEWWERHLGKLHHFLEIMAGPWAAPDYPTCPHTP
jgi:hypothetical protein